MPNPTAKPPNPVIPGIAPDLQSVKDALMNSVMSTQGIDQNALRNAYARPRAPSLWEQPQYDPYAYLEIRVEEDFARDGMGAYILDKETGRAFQGFYSRADMERIFGALGTLPRTLDEKVNVLMAAFASDYNKYKESLRTSELERMVKLWQHQKDHWQPTKRDEAHSCFDWLPGEDPPTDEKPLRRVTFRVHSVTLSASNAAYHITCDVPEVRGTILGFVVGPKPMEEPPVASGGYVMKRDKGQGWGMGIARGNVGTILGNSTP